MTSKHYGVLLADMLLLAVYAIYRQFNFTSFTILLYLVPLYAAVSLVITCKCGPYLPLHHKAVSRYTTYLEK